LSSDLAGIDGAKRLGFGGSAARRREVGEGPDRWAPPVSLRREGRAGAAAAWAELGRARERERREERLGRKRPNGQEGETLNFLNKNNL
jgi:hypothetical protein